MKLKNGNFIKKLRIQANLTQDELGEQFDISGRQIGRLERSETKICMWQFIALAELAGMPSEDFWMMHLETNEFEEYQEYKLLKGLIKRRKLPEAKDALSKFKERKSLKSVYLRQYIALASVILDEEISNKDAVAELESIMRMTKPNYDEGKVLEYRLTYNEVSILIRIISNLFADGQEERAVSLAKTVVDNRENLQTSIEDRAAVLPALMSNMSSMLGKMDRYKESLEYCLETIKICEESENFRLLPKVLYNAASCYRILGEEEQIYITYIVRAYYAARAMGQHDLAKIIKEDAENPEKFGIKLTY